MMKRIFWGVIFLWAVGPGVCLADTDHKVMVVATYSILGDLIQNIGGDRIELHTLVGPNGDTHTFEPTPKESILLVKADIIFENGLYFEPWIDPLYQASGSKAKRVVVTEGIEPIALATQEKIDFKGNPKDVDPHVWHDVNNGVIMVERIRDGLTAVDPAHADDYKRNTEKYLAELIMLDHRVQQTLKDIPPQKRKLVTSHNTLGYFARRYGFKVIGAVIPSATTEAEDPSAGTIARLLDAIKTSGVQSIFAENIHNQKLIQTLSQEAGVALAPSLYTDALGEAGSPGDSYIKMIQYNVKIIAEYLK